MNSAAEAFASAAEALVGARFRMHGRDPATGLDCLGVAIAALERAGIRLGPIKGYGLRNSRIDHLLTLAGTAGFETATPPFKRGDLLLVRPGPAQHHLLIAVGGGYFVHAHAGLRRVVRHHGALDAAPAAQWRLKKNEE